MFPVKNALRIITEQHRPGFPNRALEGRSQRSEDPVANAGRRFRIRPKQLLAMRNEARLCGSGSSRITNQCQPQPVELAAKLFRSEERRVGKESRARLAV